MRLIPIYSCNNSLCYFLFLFAEEIGIDSPDEREVILSEIYRRFHPEEEDMFEMEIQGNISCLLCEVVMMLSCFEAFRENLLSLDNEISYIYFYFAGKIKNGC